MSILPYYPMKGTKPEVVTLCGSTKFKDQFIKQQKLLTLEGKIVISVGLFGHSGDTITEDQKTMLDDLHKRKIDMSDSIFVINVDGYIGESTKKEIEYAFNAGKYVYYLEHPLVDQESKRESAWLIESRYKNDVYWWKGKYFNFSFSPWSSDSLEAIRFSRKEDAEKVIKILSTVSNYDDYSVYATDHVWQ